MNKRLSNLLLLMLIFIGASSTIYAQSVYYQKITSKAELVDDAEYIIVCEDQSVAMGEIGSNNKGSKVSVSINNGLIDSSTIVGIAKEFIYREYTHHIRFDNGNGFYLHAGDNKGSTNLKIESNDKSSQWHVSFDADGNVLMYTDVDDNCYLMFKKQTYDYFGYFGKSDYEKDGFAKIQLYRKVDQVTLSEIVNAYGTYFTTYAYRLPEGVDGYAIYHNGVAGDAITPTLAYAAGSVVPANTALLLKGNATGNYYLLRLDKTNNSITVATGIENNCLEGARNSEGVATSKNENVYYYKLTTKEGVNPGFYWGAENGVAFKLKKATTAYLALPQNATTTQSLRLDFTTSIHELPLNSLQETTGIYTLSGMKMDKAIHQLPKGIYIVDGKKIMVK